MLDLVFLVLMIIVLLKSLKGDFNLLMCNIATVVGVVAAIVGIISAFFSGNGDSFGFGVMNILVLVIAFLLKPVAKRFVKLYQDKIEEETRSYNEEAERIHENFFRQTAPVDSYLDASERGTNPPGANAPASGEIPQGYNGDMANNPAFTQNGNAIQRPMATNNVTFLPDGSIMPNPAVTNSAVFTQNENPAATPMAAGSAAFTQTANPAAAPLAAGNSAFPQNGNPAPSPMTGNNPTFTQNGNSSASPMAANSAAFTQTANPAPSPMTGNNPTFTQTANPAANPTAANIAVFPQNENAAPYSEKESSIPPIDLNEPIGSGTDDNYGLPYDLSAPIDLNHGIDDISLDNKK